MVEKVKPSRKLLEKWVREDEEFRVIRRRMANWDYIMKQPPRVRLALMVYIETGDIYRAARIAGLSIDEFNDVRIKASIPHIT
ncbi:MAG: hypothetical protein DRN49_05955 [Thaumarchaeota archaeon]|nr:MAG: hypothetical protein DRN49_05955 [Nitrososphaerota archaeon]